MLIEDSACADKLSFLSLCRCGHVICSECSKHKVKLRAGSIRTCDDCFVSFNPSGGRRSFKPVNGGASSLNEDGYSKTAPSKAVQESPAQTLLGAEPTSSATEYTTYQNEDDATQPNPDVNANATRQLYESPLAEKPDSGCCCVIC